MTCLRLLVLLSLLIGCDDSFSRNKSSQPSLKVLEVNATGINKPVTLAEHISNTSHQITSDGTHKIPLFRNQQLFELEIINSQRQKCSLDKQNNLSCMPGMCTREYRPVCAKKTLAGVQCITTPCPTSRYITYSNACEAHNQNAMIAIETDCQGLDGITALSQKPVHITDINLIDTISDSFEIESAQINEDILTMRLEIAGGCGSHHFDFFTHNTFIETMPVKLDTLINYSPNDQCDQNEFIIEKVFDLLPVKEVFRRNYPNAKGPQEVILRGIGSYRFNLN